jgi:TonB family protein
MPPSRAQETPAEETPVSGDPADEPQGEDPAPEPPGQTAFPRLPSLEFAPAAPYPPEALQAGLEGAVLLELEVSEEGEVLSAQIVEPAGSGFDEAALSAVRNFRFSPALSEDGEPVPARIQYRYRFTLEHVPVLAIQGRILAAGIRQPLVGARVVLLDAAGTSLEALTDAEGTFRFADIEPGAYAIAVRAAGRGEEVAQVEVSEGQVSEVTMYLVPDRAWEGEDYNDEMVIIGQRVEPEIVQRALDASEIRTMPGTGGDIVRAVQSLPGVARSPFNAGQVIVRGTGPDDSGFYLGGTRLPLVFHFGGLSTVINSDSLGEVAYMPGNYGVRYGRHLGGAVELRTKKTLPERSGGYTSVDLFQSAVFVQKQLSDTTALTLSARRSYIDTLLQPIINAQTSASIQLPRFWDIQARLLWRDERGGSFDTMLLVSQDEFSYSESSSDTTAASEISTGFTKAWIQRQKVRGGGWVTEATVIGGPEAQLATYESDEAYAERTALGFRYEVYRDVPDEGWVGWRMGIDTEVSDEAFSYAIEDLTTYISYAGDEEGRAQVYNAGVYLEQTQRAGRVEGVPGVRVDAMIIGDQGYLVAADPRFALRIEASDTTRLRGSIGRYSQFPLLRELLPSSGGNTRLQPEWALQSSVGIDQELMPGLTAEVTLYHGWLNDLVSGREDRFVFILGPPPTAPLDFDSYANDGTGRSFGAESLIRYEDPRLMAWAGLTLSQATRVKRPDLERVFFEYDQPVVLTMVGSYRWPRSWTTGLRLRYGSGNPYTPVVNRVMDLENHTYLPIYDTSTTARMPSFFTLDARVDKAWVYDRWTLTAYLDLQNATNRRNVEMISWSYDWADELPIYGLPIIPAFGLRGEW